MTFVPAPPPTRPLAIKSSLSEQVVDFLAQSIVGGELNPGDSLPSEADIAIQFGVSKPTARETLKRLEGLGLIEIAQGKRTIVNDQSQWDVLAPLVANAFRAVGRAGALERQYWELRRIVEIAAARYAAERATPEQCAELLKIVADTEAEAAGTPDMTRIRDLDAAFHDLIGRASANYVLRRVSVPVYGFLLWLRRLTPDAVGTVLEHHRTIAEAIHRGDPDAAAAAMETHVEFSEAININRAG
jgi:GntR family transcriptional regulator, transcriptional repressor for pyruvate dehydrogenase complex